jgi:hypothetical protein
MVGSDALRRADKLIPRMGALLDVYHDMFGTQHLGVVAGVVRPVDLEILVLSFRPDGELCQAEIARRLDCSDATVSRSVGRLEAAGLVQVTAAGSLHCIKATDAGRSTVHTLYIRAASEA